MIKQEENFREQYSAPQMEFIPVEIPGGLCQTSPGDPLNPEEYDFN